MTTDPVVVGRLAPTPSGDLHLGNILAFGAAWLSVRQQGGTLLLRIEDVDRGRARAAIEAQQKRDLEWLGLHWDREVAPQRERDYQPWLDQLGPLAYHCTRSRADFRAADTDAAEAAAGHAEGAVRFHIPDGHVTVVDRRHGPHTVALSDQRDPVLQRRDGVFAYTLAVVADDIADGVTEVVRGSDLLDFTGVQQALWHAFGEAPPSWLHTPLILGPDGRKLGKSHGSTSIADLRALGWSPRQVWATLLPWLGCDGDDLMDAVPQFAPTGGPLGPLRLSTLPDARGADLRNTQLD